jgi:GT2 family glycosyltransferase
MTRIAAVVLNYRNWPDTLEVVRSVHAQTLPVDLVIVVDNASGPEEVDAIEAARARQFDFVALARNDGYAAGMNAGIRMALDAGAEAVLLLTHDARLEPTCVELLADELGRNPVAGIAAPVLGWKGRDAVTWSAGGTLAALTGTPHHPEKGLPLDQALSMPTRSVAWADGAALLVRSGVLRRLGLLPEQYFLYFEEVDFQARVRRSGGQVRIVSGALAWQSPGGTPRYLAARNQLLWLRSGQRRAIPFFLATVAWTCGREVIRRVVGRAPDLNLVRALVLGVSDGMSGRLRPKLFTLA